MPLLQKQTAQAHLKEAGATDVHDRRQHEIDGSHERRHNVAPEAPAQRCLPNVCTP